MLVRERVEVQEVLSGAIAYVTAEQGPAVTKADERTSHSSTVDMKMALILEGIRVRAVTGA